MAVSIELLVGQMTSLARRIFGEDFVPLHRPVFEGNERQYLVDCIDSNFRVFGRCKGQRVRTESGRIYRV